MIQPISKKSPESLVTIVVRTAMLTIFCVLLVPGAKAKSGKTEYKNQSEPIPDVGVPGTAPACFSPNRVTSRNDARRSAPILGDFPANSAIDSPTAVLAEFDSADDDPCDLLDSDDSDVAGFGKKCKRNQPTLVASPAVSLNELLGEKTAKFTSTPHLTPTAISFRPERGPPATPVRTPYSLDARRLILGISNPNPKNYEQFRKPALRADAVSADR